MQGPRGGLLFRREAPPQNVLSCLWRSHTRLIRALHVAIASMYCVHPVTANASIDMVSSDVIMYICQVIRVAVTHFGTMHGTKRRAGSKHGVA
jgi:hypothetical protein